MNGKKKFMKEIWKNILGFEGVYLISNFGRVKRILQKSGTQSNRILKDYDNGKGYRYITLRKDNTPSNHYVHILVAIAFLENPLNKSSVNHINGIKSDNVITNLEWVTNKENMIHASKMNLLRKGENNVLSKINNEDVLKIRSLKNSGKALNKIGMMFGISASHVHRIMHKKLWKHI